MLSLILQIVQGQTELTFEIIFTKIILIIYCHKQNLFTRFNIEGKHFIPHWINIIPHVVRLMLLIAEFE